MVRHGKDKKRRAGRKGRTKLKNKQYRRWNPKPAFTDPIVKKNWDPTKTPTQNMERLGLMGTPNPVVASTTTKEKDETAKTTTVIALYDIPDSDAIQSNKKKKQPQHPMKLEDQKYIAKCLAKHGDDYGAMFRDIKTNNLQHSEGVLRKLASRFLLLDPQQRRVSVPEKVEHFLVRLPSSSNETSSSS